MAHHQANSSSQLTLEIGETEKKIYPKNLTIVWGDDSRYWNVPEDGPAELYQVCWLEVTGVLNNISGDKAYEVGFDINTTADAFGWSNSPVYVMAKRGKSGRYIGNKISLDKVQGTEIKVKLRADKSENNGQESDDSKQLHFGLYEVWSGKWKGGLKINHAFVREST